METAIEKLTEIEAKLDNIRVLLIGKSNLYCPGCKTFNDILCSINGILNNIALLKESYKVDDVISRLDRIEKAIISSREEAP